MEKSKRTLLVTLYFDSKDDLSDVERDFDRFILEYEPEIGGNEFGDIMHEVFNQKRYSWNDTKKAKQGYKDIMSIDWTDLTDIEILVGENIKQKNKLKDFELEQEEWEMEI